LKTPTPGVPNPLLGEADGVPDALGAFDQDAAWESTRRTVLYRRGHGRRDGMTDVSCVTQ